MSSRSCTRCGHGSSPPITLQSCAPGTVVGKYFGGGTPFSSQSANAILRPVPNSICKMYEWVQEGGVLKLIVVPDPACANRLKTGFDVQRYSEVREECGGLEFNYPKYGEVEECISNDGAAVISDGIGNLIIGYSESCVSTRCLVWYVESLGYYRVPSPGSLLPSGACQGSERDGLVFIPSPPDNCGGVGPCSEKFSVSCIPTEP